MMGSSVASDSSSPPTPLPVSVGPGLERYAFTPSASPSPPFFPPGGSWPLLLRAVRSEPTNQLRSALSVAKMHLQEPAAPRRPTKRLDLRWCLERLLVLVCCCCCSSSKL